MELQKQEQRDGYSVWQNEAEETYLVVDGLDPTQVHTPGTMETFMTEHYTLFAVFYWLLLVAIFTYLATHYIIRPLLTRTEDQQPSLSDQ